MTGASRAPRRAENFLTILLAKFRTMAYSCSIEQNEPFGGPEAKAAANWFETLFAGEPGAPGSPGLRERA
jgi:hypothetical protein